LVRWAEAQTVLGVLCLTGTHPLPAHAASAQAWFAKAAAQGDPDGLYNLANCLLEDTAGETSKSENGGGGNGSDGGAWGFGGGECGDGGALTTCLTAGMGTVAATAAMVKAREQAQRQREARHGEGLRLLEMAAGRGHAFAASLAGHLWATGDTTGYHAAGAAQAGAAAEAAASPASQASGGGGGGSGDRFDHRKAAELWAKAARSGNEAMAM